MATLDCFCTPAANCRRTRYTDGRQKQLWTRASLDTLTKFVDSGVTKLELQPHSGCSEAGRSYRVGSPGLKDGMQICKEKPVNKALDVLLCMDQEGRVPSLNIYLSLLKACAERKALAEAKKVYAHLTNHGLEATRFVGEYVVSVLVKCGGLEDALQLFRSLPDRTVFSWTAVISGCTTSGKGQLALSLYQQMQEEGVRPNTYTFVSLLKACGSITNLEEGKRIQAEAVKYRCESDLFVGNCMLDMYGKCGSLLDAQMFFDGMSERDVVSWNAMIAAYAHQGEADKAFQLYERMRGEGVSPNIRTFVSVIQSCGILADKEGALVLDGREYKQKSLDRGKELHADTQRKGYNGDIFVGSTLVSMYGKCRSLVDAQIVFDSLSYRDVVSWNGMLATYVEEGSADEALLLYKQMLEAGVAPDNWTFVSLLQACGLLAEQIEHDLVNGRTTKAKCLQQGKAIHAEARKSGYEPDVFVGNALICMYGKCWSIEDAYNVFNGLIKRDVVSWNSMLAAYVEQGLAEEAVQLYAQLWEEEVSPDDRTFVSVLQACGMLGGMEEPVVVDGQSVKLKSLAQGRAIHAEAKKRSYTSDAFLARTAVWLYGKCGSILDAQIIFDRLCQHDVDSWNVMLTLYVDNDLAERTVQLYEHMRKEGISPNDRTFVTVLQACGMLAEEGAATMGRQSTKDKFLEVGLALHADARRNGYDSDIFVASSLIAMYGKCGSILNARMVFNDFLECNVVLWNSMLTSYMQLGLPVEALQLYEQMWEEGVTPDNRTSVSALQALGMLAEKDDVSMDGQLMEVTFLEQAKAIHTAHVEQDQGQEAMLLYEQMWEEGVSPDDQTFVNVLQAYSQLAAKEEDLVLDGRARKLKSLKQAKVIHADARKKGYDLDVFVASSLVSTYGKCGSLVDAQNVFDGMLNRDVVSWTALIAAYVEQNQAEKSLQLCRQMLQEGVTLDEITVLRILQTCSNTGSLALLRQIHGLFLSREKGLSRSVASSLISAYGRCASMMDAQNVFDSLAEPEVVSWTALIAGYGRSGDCAACLQCYDRMQLAGVKPNGVTFLAVLSASSHAGLVDKGVEYFESMSRDHGIPPGIEHYVSMVDLLGRAGYFEGIAHMMSTMTVQPNLSTWLSLLAACRKHGKVELGERAFNCAVRLQPQHAAAYVLMSNIYADAGLLESAKKLNKKRQKGGAWREPGQSWIEHEEKICTFLVAERPHIQHEQLYDLLRMAKSKLSKESHFSHLQYNIERRDSLSDY